MVRDISKRRATVSLDTKADRISLFLTSFLETILKKAADVTSVEQSDTVLTVLFDDDSKLTVSFTQE